MMTDIDHLRRMLDSKNIPYDTNQFNDETHISIQRGSMHCEVVFIFDSNGEFVDVGAFPR